MKSIEKEIIEFSMLKELACNDYIPNSKDYGISDDMLYSLYESMVDEGLLNPKRLIFDILGFVEILDKNGLITNKGYNFIEEHEGWNHIYKEIGDINKLLDGGEKND